MAVILTPSAGADADYLLDAAKGIRASSDHKGFVIPTYFLPGVRILNAIIFLVTLEALTPFACFSRQNFHSHQYASMKSLNESKQGFWGSLARKAKSFLDDDDTVQNQFESDGPPKSKLPQSQMPAPELIRIQLIPRCPHHNTSNPALQNGIGAIASSLSYIGNAVEHIKKKSSGSAAQNEAAKLPQKQQQVQIPVQVDQEIQLRHLVMLQMAMAAKAKLLLRELKIVRTDLAFAKERFAQLEEENRNLPENGERGNNPENDDLVLPSAKKQNEVLAYRIMQC
ncbi:hypothetical protein V6N12_025798 [Hibiscus sabdariffa]|uniref:Uncharacterized protein n=1 Tax=Hibiscus sabdariffa TaxID=183260 RepID=A0ABR2DRD0_9ROSI